jgi:hypothetical protein
MGLASSAVNVGKLYAEFGDLRHSDPFALLCQNLEKIGDERGLDLLEPFVSDQQKGPIAIKTIRSNQAAPPLSGCCLIAKPN